MGCRLSWSCLTFVGIICYCNSVLSIPLENQTGNVTADVSVVRMRALTELKTQNIPSGFNETSRLPQQKSPELPTIAEIYSPSSLNIGDVDMLAGTG